MELKSNVTLHLAPSGRLLGIGNREHYSSGKGVPPGKGNVVMLYAVNAENITIEGQGTIDGQGGNTGPGGNAAQGNPQAEARCGSPTRATRCSRPAGC